MRHSFLLFQKKKKKSPRDITKIEKSEIVLSHVVDILYNISIKIWFKQAQGYKSNNLLLLYQYPFIDVFFRKSLIKIGKITIDE